MPCKGCSGGGEVPALVEEARPARKRRGGWATLFPLAWANDPAMSSLETFDDCRKRLSALGLRAGEFLDRSAEGQQCHLANMKAMQNA